MLAVAIFVTGVLSHAACGTDEPTRAAIGGGCVVNTDCADPLVCAFRTCHEQCTDDRDCAATQICVAAERPLRVCAEPQKCSYNSECAEPLLCARDGHCRNQCATDRDCVPEQVCASGSCAKASELVDGGLPVALSSDTTEGLPCQFDSDCGPLHCLGGTCLRECTTNDDCESHVCEDAGVCKKGSIFCLPGQVVQCVCPGGETGSQTCLPDGSGVGPCDACPDAGAG